jgi:DNA repair protein RadC
MDITLKESLAEKLRYAIPRMKLLLVHEQVPNHRKVTIKRPQDAAKLLMPLKHSPDEQFVSIHLNAKSEVVGLHEVSHGTVSSSLVHPREVFKAAILANSFAIIVCHNHPSGASISPSPEDMDTTKQLIAAGNLLNICLVDHVIVGPRSRHAFYSMREHHPELWPSS